MNIALYNCFKKGCPNVISSAIGNWKAVVLLSVMLNDLPAKDPLHLEKSAFQFLYESYLHLTLSLW